jgi:hypothetical protein
MVVGGPSASVDAGDAEAAIANGEVEADGVSGPSAAVNVGDAETAIAKGEVEADGVPGILASMPPGEIDTAASATVGDETAATPDDETTVALSEEGRPTFPGGTTSDNTGSGCILPCMNDRTREGCKVRGVDWEGIEEPPEAIRCGECTRARSTNSFPLGVVGELLYGVRASVTLIDGAAAFP